MSPHRDEYKRAWGTGKATDAQLIEAYHESLVSLGILPFGPPKSTALLVGTKKSNRCVFAQKQGLNPETPRWYCEAQNKEVEKRNLLHPESFYQKTEGIIKKRPSAVVCDPERCQYYTGSGIKAQYSIRHYVDVKLNRPLSWNLAGNGASYEACGHIWWDEGKGCLNVKEHPGGLIYVRLVAGTCFRFECPVCYQKACSRQAGRIEDRFLRIPKVAGVRENTAEATAIGTDKTGRLGKPIHLVVSVPEAEAHMVNGDTLRIHQGKFKRKSNYSMLRSKAYKIAKKAGFKGGCCIFHPFANDKMHDTDHENVVWDKSDDGVDLEWLKGYFDKQDRHVGFWYWRPHFHFIGYGWIEGTDELHDKTGWVVVNLGVRDSVYYTALYQLSHAGVKKGVQVVTWMGCMGNSVYHKLNPAPMRPPSRAKCPECGSYLNPVRWEGDGDPPLDGCEEGGYWIDPGGWRYLDPEEKNHSCLVRRPDPR